MADDVVVSPTGIRSLMRLTREQHDHLRAIWEFTRDQQLYESHWFDKGFLKLFQGDYDAATDDVFASLSNSSDGTYRLVERIGHSRDLLAQADRDVETTMAGLHEVTEAVEAPEFANRYGGITNVGGVETPPEKPPKHRGPGGDGSASDSIDAINSLLSMGHHTDQIADGITTDNELGDFVEENSD